MQFHVFNEQMKKLSIANNKRSGFNSSDYLEMVNTYYDDLISFDDNILLEMFSQARKKDYNGYFPKLAHLVQDCQEIKKKNERIAKELEFNSKQNLIKESINSNRMSKDQFADIVKFTRELVDKKQKLTSFNSLISSINLTEIKEISECV